jgi:hypothetical protein
VLVVNRTRVIRARLLGIRASGRRRGPFAQIARGRALRGDGVSRRKAQTRPTRDDRTGFRGGDSRGHRAPDAHRPSGECIAARTTRSSAMAHCRFRRTSTARTRRATASGIRPSSRESPGRSRRRPPASISRRNCSQASSRAASLAPKYCSTWVRERSSRLRSRIPRTT